MSEKRQGVDKSYGSAKPASTHIEQARPSSIMEENDHSLVSVNEDDLSVMATLIKNPIVILCVMYGNLGALMYGFDNISLSLCLDMEPFMYEHRSSQHYI